MAKSSPLINNFNGGEISPLVNARHDINKYFSGCRTLENFVPLIEGGAKRMPGTYYLNAIYDVSKKARLIPFSYSTVQTYIIEMGNLYMRFYKDQGQIVIDTSMDDFDPTADFFVGEYTKAGYYTQIDFGGIVKSLYVAFPYALGAGLLCYMHFAADDTLVAMDGTIADPDNGTLHVYLANATPAKNAANLIQVAIQALGTVGAVDVSDVTVTENAAYAAARPTSGSISGAYTPIARLFQCLVAQTGEDTNTNAFPNLNDTTNWDNVTAGNPVHITTPYLEAELPEIRKPPQSADVLYIFHRAHPPAKLVRHSHINWEYVTLDCIGTTDIAKTGANGIAKIISDITKANPAAVKVKNHGFVAGDQVYINHVLGMVEVNQEIYTVAEHGVDPTNKFNLLGVDSTDFTTYSSGGTVVKVETVFNAAGDYPACGCFFEQGLCVGGSDNAPHEFQRSTLGDYENFVSDPESDDGAIRFTFASGSIDRIRWMIGQDYLLLGTIGGVIKAGASSVLEPMTQSNVAVRKDIHTGVADVDPQACADGVLWITRSANTMRLAMFSYEKDKIVAPDMTRIARHISFGATRALSGIIETALQNEPFPILWAIRKDGQLLGMTFDMDEKVYPWFRVVTDGEFESIAVISKDNDEDELWAIVKRVINGVTLRYVEFFKPHEFFSELKDCFFVHSGLSYDGGDEIDITGITKANPAVVTALGHSFEDGDKVQITDVEGMTEINCEPEDAFTVAGAVAGVSFQLQGVNSSAYITYSSGGVVKQVTNSLSNLTHLEGKTVDILVDGAVHSQEIVSGGAISLEYYGNQIHVGLPAPSILEPSKLNVASQVGTSRGKKQKITRLTAVFNETVGGQYGPDQDSLYDIPFASTNTPELHSEDIKAEFPAQWEDEAGISIVQNEPLPMTVLAIVPRFFTNED